MELFFIRHGATAGNLERRYIGKTDEALCETGIVQAKKLARLAADVLFVSPLQRARQTAAQAFPDLPQTVVADFAETDFGVFEGKTAAELSQSTEYRAWVESGCMTPIPEGEAVDAFKARCCHGFLREVSRLPQDATAAFVVHGGVIMAILEAFCPENPNFYAYHLKNGDFFRCTFADGKITQVHHEEN